MANFWTMIGPVNRESYAHRYLDGTATETEASPMLGELSQLIDELRMFQRFQDFKTITSTEGYGEYLPDWVRSLGKQATVSQKEAREEPRRSEAREQTVSVEPSPAMLALQLGAMALFTARDFVFKNLEKKIMALLAYKGKESAVIGIASEEARAIHGFVYQAVKEMAAAAWNRKWKGHVLGLAGEISGIFQVVIQKHTALSYINLGRLRAFHQFVRDGSRKEFDAVSDRTVFEFKFHASLLKLYEQIVGLKGVNKTPHMQILVEKEAYQNIRNLVYFGEADQGYLVKALTAYLGKSHGTEGKPAVEIEGAKNISVKFSLRQLKSFLLDPDVLQLLQAEAKSYHHKIDPRKIELAEWLDRKEKQIRDLPAKSDGTKEKFDVILSVSNATPWDIKALQKTLKDSEIKISNDLISQMEKNVTVQNPKGVHQRPALAIRGFAEAIFDYLKIRLFLQTNKNGEKTDAMGYGLVMALGLSDGSSVIISAEAEKGKFYPRWLFERILSLFEELLHDETALENGFSYAQNPDGQSFRKIIKSLADQYARSDLPAKQDGSVPRAARAEMRVYPDDSSLPPVLVSDDGVEFWISYKKGSREGELSIVLSYEEQPIGRVDFRIDPQMDAAILDYANDGQHRYVGIEVEPFFSQNYFGIGTALMGLAFRIAQDEGIPEFFVLNSKADYFYRSLGMIEIREGTFRFPLEGSEMAKNNLSLPPLDIRLRSRSEIRGFKPLAKWKEKIAELKEDADYQLLRHLLKNTGLSDIEKNRYLALWLMMAISAL